MNVSENNLRDDQSEAKVQNDVMGEKKVHESPWKQGLTDVSGARGVAAPVPRTGQCRHDKGKNSQGWDPRTHEEKSGPTAGKKPSGTQEEKSGPVAGERA